MEIFSIKNFYASEFDIFKANVNIIIRIECSFQI